MKKEKLIKELLSWLGTLTVSLVLVSFVYLLVIRPVRVDGNSMNPTLNNNDFVLIIPRVSEVNSRDVVVLQSNNKNASLYVKRVIATEGQTVDIDKVNGRIIVDGVSLRETYIMEDNYILGDVTYPQTVKQGHVFVLGDNRNHSTDSRFSSLGQVPVEDIEGKVIFRLSPIDKMGKVS